jgi:hypothetical protein
VEAEMNLKEYKESLEIVSPDKEKNIEILEQILLDDDCFGRGYEEKGKECRGCTICARVAENMVPLNMLCKELTNFRKENEMNPLEQTTKFIVESGIPYPGNYERRQPRYPFKSMEIGQSFSFEEEDRKSISTAAYKFNEGTQLKFSVRRSKDGSYRIWRIDPSNNSGRPPIFHSKKEELNKFDDSEKEILKSDDHHKMMGRIPFRNPKIVSDITLKPFMEKAVEKLMNDFGSLPTISLVKGYMDYYRKSSEWQKIFNRVSGELLKEGKIRIKHKHIYKKPLRDALKEKCAALKELQEKYNNLQFIAEEEKVYREEIQKGLRAI